MQGAERLGVVTSTGNFSYAASRSWGEGWAMIGDSFAFVDPVFSSGVLLAMTAGEMGAEVADAWLDNPAAGRARARRMERDLRHAMARISWLIYRINTPALRLLFLAPSNKLRMRDGLVSLLAGNLRGSRETLLPVLAFKTVYALMALALRLGLPVGAPPVRALPQPAE
jgi:flavin-dependent dehydrogenase